MYPYDPNNQNQYDQTIPNQPYTSNLPPPPPVKPKKKNIFRWYWRQHPAVKIAIGCPASIVAAFVVLFLVVLVIVLATPSTWQPHATAQVAQTHTTVTTPKPTVKPTVKPTPTPQPTPTPVPPTPTPVPTVDQPTQPPAPAQPACAGTVMGGTCYNTDPNGGTPVNDTPPGFCFQYSFVCIDNFADGTGSIVECGNMKWSHSGGRPGACSRDGGVIATLYSH